MSAPPLEAARDDEVRAAGELLDRHLATPRLKQLVARSFGPDLDRSRDRFAGETFTGLGSNPPDRITADDLLAVSLLDVAFSAPAVRTMLEDRASEASELLSRISTEIDLWAADVATVQPASDMWIWVDALPGAGPVKAGKLLARKRPRLIPVIDRVVEVLMSLPSGRGWVTLGAALTPERVRQVEALRPDGLDEHVTTLRLLDVALWLLGSGSGAALAACEAVGITSLSSRGRSAGDG